jgi:hypothetical protein
VIKLAQRFRDRAEELLTIDVSDDVLSAHWELEKQYKAAAMASPRADAAGPAMKRLSETVLKVASLLAIDRGGIAVAADDLMAARTMAERWQRTTLALIADIGRTKFQARCDAVLGTIRANPKGITQYGLYRAHRDLDKREYENVTDALEMQELIHSVELPTPGKKGRVPVTWYPGAPRDGE